jgi:hypothetical protein
MRAQRLVIVTRDDLEHRYVANVLCAALPIDGIVVTEPTSTLSHRAWRVASRATLASVPRRAYRRLVYDVRLRRSSFARILGGAMTAGFHRGDLVRRVRGVNSDETRRLLGELRPDFMLVYGTDIVADRILELAGKLALNMHTGISPYYRGADTWFWPLVNRELHMVGATVHECTRKVDGGPIFMTARARLEPTRNAYDLFAWSIVAGAEIYVEVVGECLGGRLRGRPQDLSLGREYRSAERTPAQDRLARRLIRAGFVDEYVRSSSREPELAERPLHSAGEGSGGAPS